MQLFKRLLVMGNNIRDKHFRQETKQRHRETRYQHKIALQHTLWQSKPLRQIEAHQAAEAQLHNPQPHLEQLDDLAQHANPFMLIDFFQFIAASSAACFLSLFLYKIIELTAVAEPDVYYQCDYSN